MDRRAELAQFLRAKREQTRHPGNRSLATLVVRLRERTAAFDEGWKSHNVAFQQFGTRELNHPVVGRLAIDFQGLQPMVTTGCA